MRLCHNRFQKIQCMWGFFFCIIQIVCGDFFICLLIVYQFKPNFVFYIIGERNVEVVRPLGQFKFVFIKNLCTMRFYKNKCTVVKFHNISPY